MVKTNSKYEDSDFLVKQYMSVSQHDLNTPEDRTFLQNSTCLRDRANNVMARKEVIDLIVDMCGSIIRNQAENHLEYIIISGQIPYLKAGGRVIFAKNTTTKRSFICVKWKFRWYMVVQFNCG